ncbi:MAG: Jag N-terminal domain-containing protein [Elusimicrobiaceae bacterium]|nr:Jag N-terminal domain-containing protein [Elusimicrobiaceae bacterium]MBQ6224066.1 Jag N-terminal domain-containing protein [Campylobacter sp.]
MARREITAEGRDVGEAITKGLHQLGRRRDQVEVSVVQEEKPGFLGIGSKPAIVKIIEKKWDSENSTPMKPRTLKKNNFKATKGKKKVVCKPARLTKAPKEPKENEPQKLPSLEIQNAVIPENLKEPMSVAKESLIKIIEGIGAKTENVNVWWDQKQERMLITFDCDSPALIIGKEGHTLEAIQYVITLMVSRYFDNPISVICDTQNYWRKLEDKVNDEIERAVKMLMRTKKTYRFRPMSAQRRRYIHRYLVDRTDISTASEGEGKWRKVVLRLQTTQTMPADNNTPVVNTNPQESITSQINQAVSYGQDTQEALRKMQEEQAKAAMAAEEASEAVSVQTEVSASNEPAPVATGEVAPVQEAPVQEATTADTITEQK